MAISVTTRSGKGSELTTSEMDNNLTSLARSATTAQEGNIRLATQSEVNAGSATNLAISPATLTSRVEDIIDDNAPSSSTTDTLYNNSSGVNTGTVAISDKSSYDLITIEARTNQSEYSTMVIPNSVISGSKEYYIMHKAQGSSGQGDGIGFQFPSDTTMTVYNPGGDDTWNFGIVAVYGTSY